MKCEGFNAAFKTLEVTFTHFNVSQETVVLHYIYLNSSENITN